MRYTVNNNGDCFFIRKDNNSNIIMIKKTSEQFLLNRSGLEIFDLILENTDSERVEQKMINNHPSVDENIIKSDVKNIFRMMKIYNILMIDNTFVNEQSDKETVSAVDEDNYGDIEGFIENNRNDGNLISGGKGYYSPQTIRSHIMNNQEYYYSYVRDGKILGLATVIPNNSINCSVVKLTALVLDGNLSDKERNEIGNRLIRYISDNMLAKVTKIRVSVLSGKPDETLGFIKYLKKLGFVQECILFREFNESNMYIWSYEL